MRFSRRATEGYLLIDHRAGAGTAAVPGGAVFEAPMATCGHCQQGIILNPLRTRDRAWCPSCDRYVCDTCEGVRVATGQCRSFARVMDEAQEAAAKGI